MARLTPRPSGNHKRPAFSGRTGVFLLALLWLLVLPACGSDFQLPRLPLPAPAATPASTLPPTPAAAPSSTTAPLPTAPQTTAVVDQNLIVWVPPDFDPAGDTPAGRLLKDRLSAFEKTNPGVTVNVRVKAVGGPGGLLEALAATTTAAPSVAPALVALSRSDLETAALKGLITPLDGLTQAMEDADWYPYAQQLAQIQGATFGLPFGGDALLMVYRPARLGPPPADWNAILRLAQPLVFPAADPQALFTLALYQMLGGPVSDEQKRPTLQPETLAKSLDLYADGIQQGVFPYWLSTIQTDKQAWQAYRDQRAQWLVTWSSEYLKNVQPDSLPVALPSLGDKPFTPASGWLWALSDPLPERRALSVKLAEFLTAREFLSSWDYAAGMLPTRPSVLSGWQDQTLRSVMSGVVLSAQLRPSNDLMAALGPALQSATLQVIKREDDANQAARSAAERLAVPGVK